MFTALNLVNSGTYSKLTLEFSRPYQRAGGAGGAANDVLERDGRTLARLHIAFRRQKLTNQDELERADVTRILVDRVVMRLRRQLAGGSQVLNNLTQVALTRWLIL